MANRIIRWRRGGRFKDPNRNLRQREWQLYRAYAEYHIAAWPILLKLSKKERRQYEILIMLRAMEHPTYVKYGTRYFCPRRGFMKKNGEPRKDAIDKAKYFLDLARRQQALLEIFQSMNFGPERHAEIIADIANNRDLSPSDRMRAVDMGIRLTYGYAPTKSGVLHAHAHVDNFFDEAEFKNPPPVTIDGSAT